MLEKRSAIFSEFTRFFVVGVGATIVHIGVYLLLNACFGITEANPPALTTTYAIGYLVSFGLNYLITLKWTFKTKGTLAKGVGFALSHGINAGMHLLLLNLFSYLKIGQFLSGIILWLLPWAAELFPIITEPETLLPLPVYLFVVPMNFLMVRYFLKRPTLPQSS
jgi:putative flippase GtrA